MSPRRLALISTLALALLCVLLAPKADAKIVAYGSLTIQAEASAPVRGFVACFTTTRDNAQSEEFNITIDWGDGDVTSGSVVNDGSGRFRVFGNHACKEKGVYKVKVRIFDPILGYGTTHLRPGAM